VIAADGFSYERAAIEAWFARAPEPMLPRWAPVCVPVCVQLTPVLRSFDG
jgi:hypothetical protein